GEQVAAGVGLVMRALDEMLGVETLADELARHIGEGDDHRVDLAGSDGALEPLERQHAAHAIPPLRHANLAPCAPRVEEEDAISRPRTSSSYDRAGPWRRCGGDGS